MTDFQAVFDAIMKNAKAQDLKDKPIITLGDLRSQLSALGQDLKVAIQFEASLYAYDKLESYRGYYSDLSLSLGELASEEDTTTVAKVLKDLDEADGGMFTGYKGGEYWMDSSTLMWADYYSCCSGEGVTGVTVSIGVPGISSPLVIITTADCAS